MRVEYFNAKTLNWRFYFDDEEAYGCENCFLGDGR